METRNRSQEESGNESTKNGFKHNDLSGLEKDLDQFKTEYEANFVPPNFTIKELRDCIPPELFEKDVVKATGYILFNLAVCGAMFYGATFIDDLPMPLPFVAWPVWWWFQGVFLTGIWILGHECGHQSYSNSRTANNIMGYILHTSLLVPFHSWRLSHTIHHATTLNIERDQHYLPRRRSEYGPKDGKEHRHSKMDALKEAFETSSFYNGVYIISVLLVGWFTYIFYNKTGQKYPTFVSHFSPNSVIYEKKQYGQIIASDVGVLAVIAGLCYWGYRTSTWTVMKYYGIPYLEVNAWLITTTLLHHTDVFVPYYTEKAWNFARGAISTVDRDFGWFLNHALWHIQDSHVAHHLFSQMPHFNAIKATPYLKAKLGEYYLYDRTPIWASLMRVAKNCDFVEDTGDVLFYRGKYDAGKSRAA